MENRNVYNCAPLPFRGQKRLFLKDFAAVLKEVEGKVDTVVDLFGGSGLLAHTAKRVLPGCRVVYNDFDRYVDRLGAIDTTNEILMAIKERLTGVEPNQRLSESERADVLAIVDDYAKRGYVDFITIGRSVLFSGKWVASFDELCKQTMYNRVKSGVYGCGGYLDGLEVVHMDYRELFGREKGNDRVLFLMDPPYLSTECGMYEGFWRLTDYLDVVRLMDGTKWIYFTSKKSQIVELCEWLGRVYGNSPMEGSTVYGRTNCLNYHAKYIDLMITRL